MTNELKIRRISNGAILKVKNEDGNEWAEISHQFDEDNPENAISMVWEILEWLGLNFGKHDTKIFKIEVAHGREYECKESSCPVCGGKE